MNSYNHPQDRFSEYERIKRKKTGQFAAGFLGWYLVNGLIWLLVKTDISSYDEGFLFCNAIVWPANVFFTLVFSLSRESRLVGLGLLAAIATNLVIALIIGSMLNAWCFIPFFFK